MAFAPFGPKGMPDAVKANLESVATKVMADPRVHERLANLDINPNFAPAPVVRSKLESDIRDWTKFIDEKGVKPQ
jgi:tripartite-type tricarboxylate transporter receptor subunit TctC